MSVTLPPFREAFPESLMYATPQHPQPCCQHRPSPGTHGVPHHAPVPGRTYPPVPQYSHPPPQQFAPQGLPARPPYNPAQYPIPPPAAPSGGIEYTIINRPILRCPEADCNRVYSCIGNLNRHMKMVHGKPPKDETPPRGLPQHAGQPS